MSGGVGEPAHPARRHLITQGDFNPERFILDDVLAPTCRTRQRRRRASRSPWTPIADYGFGNYLYYPTAPRR